MTPPPMTPDTTGAIYGQIAGAYYGIDGIPSSWKKRLALSERILGLATALYALSFGEG